MTHVPRDIGQPGHLAEQVEELKARMAAFELSQGVAHAGIPAQIADAVREAVEASIAAHVPSAEEREFLKLAVRREARRERLQTAVIEKSLGGLAWAALLWFGVVLYEYVKTHGWKP